jgi:hypothetical protein
MLVNVHEEYRQDAEDCILPAWSFARVTSGNHGIIESATSNPALVLQHKNFDSKECFLALLFFRGDQNTRLSEKQTTTKKEKERQ